MALRPSCQSKPGAARVGPALRVEPRDHAAGIGHQQAAAAVDSGGGHQLAAVDQTELGGAAADVDVEDARLRVEAAPGGTGAEHREPAFHVVAGGGADELAALLGQHRGNRLAVLAPQRFAGEDDGAGVDGVGVQASLGIGRSDQVTERRGVDQRFTLVGRQRQRWLRQRLALDDDVARAQLVGDTLQMQLAEDHLRARRTDVDADAVQHHVVLQPERVVGSAGAVAVDVVMVMVMVTVVAVFVFGIVHAQAVVGQAVAGGHLQ